MRLDAPRNSFRTKSFQKRLEFGSRRERESWSPPSRQAATSKSGKMDHYVRKLLVFKMSAPLSFEGWCCKTRIFALRKFGSVYKCTKLNQQTPNRHANQTNIQTNSWQKGGLCPHRLCSENCVVTCSNRSSMSWNTIASVSTGGATVVFGRGNAGFATPVPKRGR